MAYFSSKSTWLSLVEGPEPAAAHPDGLPIPLEDYRPCLPAALGADPDWPAEEAPTGCDDLEQLRLTRDLRHRLFFHHKEWEFGPGLLDDHIRLAQAQTDPEEALAHYCHARFVAKTLAGEFAQPDFLPTWLETDRIIAEIHHLLGNFESCEVYAREGLETIKKNKFTARWELQITKLTVRFFHLLGRR